MMRNNLPAAPRRAWAAQQAALLVLREDIRRLPVDPRAIIRAHGWRLLTYAQAALRLSDNATAADIVELFGTADAFTAVTPRQGRVVIVYNDQIDNGQRAAFSLCHELGHIFLGHFDVPDAELTAEQRRLLDQEANAFAANLLAPVAVVDQLHRPLRATDRHIFGLSRQGWTVRLATLDEDRHALAPNILMALRRQFREFTNQRRCPACGAAFLHPLPTCAACGHALVWAPDACPMEFPWTPEAWRSAAR